MGATIIEQLKVMLGADIAEFEKKIDAAFKQMEQTGKKFQEIGGNLSKYVTVPLVAFGAASVMGFSKQEDAVNDFRAAVGGSGPAVDKLTESALKYASAVQKATVYGDEQILSVMALGKNMGISTDQLESATTAAVGLAAAYKVDINTAMQLVAKASQGQTGALSRYGIVLDQTLTKEEQFAQLLEIGAGKFGLAEAATKTFSGQLAQLKNNLGDFMELIGAQIVPMLIPLVAVFMNIATQLQTLDPMFLKIAVVAGTVAAAIGPLLLVVGKLMSMLPLLKVGFIALTGPAAILTAKIMLIAGAFIFLYANIQKVEALAKAFIFGLAAAFTKAVQGIFDSATWLAKKIPFLGDKLQIVSDKIGAASEKMASKFTVAAGEMDASGSWIGNTADFVTGKFKTTDTSTGISLENIKTNIGSVAPATGVMVADTDASLTDLGMSMDTAAAKAAEMASKKKTQTTATAKETSMAFSKLKSDVSGHWGGLVNNVSSMLVNGTGDWKATLRGFLIDMVKGIAQSAIASMLSLEALAIAFKFLSSNPYTAAIAIGVTIIGAAAVMSRFQPFAEGGIVTGPTMGLVGEAGREAIIPLDSPKANKMLGGGDGGTFIAVLQVDGQEMARKVFKHADGVLLEQGVGM